MKFNKWTLGLAALGVVSLASAAKADEKQNFLQTALSSTTISGYVDTSINYQVEPSTESAATPAGGLGIPFQGTSKQDGFNLDVVKLTIEKPLDESEWAAGYKVDLLFGPDAVAYNSSVNGLLGTPTPNGNTIGSTTSDFSIKQAYVSLRVPVGNGLELKIGSFDTIIGYEVFEAGNNPNFTRSWGYAIEPTEHTGILASYRVNDVVSLSAGVANTLSAGINNRNADGATGVDVTKGYWNKTWMGSLALTAPQSWGWAAGSSLYAGVIYGFGSQGFGGTGSGLLNIGTPTPTSPAPFTSFEPQANYYAGLTLNTPLAGLKAGIAFDKVNNFGSLEGQDASILGFYASYQATEKLSVHGRAEFGWWKGGIGGGYQDFTSTSLTGTVQYDLWQNVVSRLEVRWDHFSYDPDKADLLGLYANVIYKF